MISKILQWRGSRRSSAVRLGSDRGCCRRCSEDESRLQEGERLKWDKTTKTCECRNKVSDINFALRRRIRASAAFFLGSCDLTECASASFAELARPVLLHNGERSRAALDKRTAGAHRIYSQGLTKDASLRRARRQLKTKATSCHATGAKSAKESAATRDAIAAAPTITEFSSVVIRYPISGHKEARPSTEAQSHYARAISRYRGEGSACR